MKKILHTYRHAFLILGYMPIYLILFFWVEHLVTDSYHIIGCELDHMIPFVEWFVFPYILWFPYIALGVLAFILYDKDEYFRLAKMLITGMSIFLFVSFVFPNGLSIRPDLSSLGRENLAITLLSKLHKLDTQTNVCPSIHVFNSVAVCFAFFHSEVFRKKKVLCGSLLVLSVLVCLSTLFIKQHSVIDVVAALLMFVLLLAAYYRKKKPAN